jgi:hypothetical protein
MVQRENKPASLVSGTTCSTRFIPFALITVASPAQATTIMLRLATLRSIQRQRAGWFPPSPALWTAVQRLLVLFTVFKLLSWVNYTGSI